MKFLKNCKYWLAIFALPLVVVACMTIEEIVHPDDAKVNSEIDITVLSVEDQRLSRLLIVRGEPAEEDYDEAYIEEEP